MFSLQTDSDFSEIVPRLSLPLLMKINEKKENVRRCVSQDHMRYWLSRDHEVVEESQFAVQIPPLKLRMFNIVRLVTLQKNLSPSVLFSDRLKSSLSFRRCALRYIKTNWKNENQSTKRMTHKHIFIWNQHHLWTKGNKLTTSNLFAYRCSRTTANPFFNSPHRRLCNNDRNQIFELVNTNGRVEIGLWSEHVCVSNWINTELYEGHNKKRCWMLVVQRRCVETIEDDDLTEYVCAKMWLTRNP